MDTSVNAANKVVSVGADIAFDDDPKFFDCLVRFESYSVPTTLPTAYDVYPLDGRHDGGYYTVKDCVTIDVLPRFFFQAEDGIRDDLVTGVQTCALPISRRPLRHDADRALHHPAPPAASRRGRRAQVLRELLGPHLGQRHSHPAQVRRQLPERRSEERRVGKECRARGRSS